MKEAVKFRLVRLSTDQFGILRDMYEPDAPIGVNTQLAKGSHVISV